MIQSAARRNTVCTPNPIKRKGRYAIISNPVYRVLQAQRLPCLQVPLLCISHSCAILHELEPMRRERLNSGQVDENEFAVNRASVALVMGWLPHVGIRLSRLASVNPI